MMYPAAGVTDGSGMQYVKEWIAMFQNPVMWINIVALPINYFYVFIAFFGEEYGWRYYLQPVLQKRFGLRAGEYPKVCVNLQTGVRYNYSVWRFLLWQEEKVTHHRKQQCAK